MKVKSKSWLEARVVEENVERADVESLRCKLCIGLIYNVSYEII